MKDLPTEPWISPGDTLLSSLNVSAEHGLSTSEAQTRALQYGVNRLREIKPPSVWTILFNQMKGVIVLFLLAAVAACIAFGEYVDAFAIGIVIVINTFIGFVTELKGVRSIEALRKLGAVNSKVRRDGLVYEVPAEDLVPGDIVLLEAGDIVTADLRLLTVSRLQADESVLTGESVPVDKSVDPLEAEISLAERTNMLFKGTAVTRGSGEAVAVATGMTTELGKISSLIEETKDEITPLEERLNRLAHKLIWISVAIGALVGVSGIAAGRDLFLMIETAIALAVAAIPEGLPVVATVALARGVWRMARRQALIKQISSVETLGATSVICTDKTGTLTENRMTAAVFSLSTGDLNADVLNGNNRSNRAERAFESGMDGMLLEALEIGVLCNNASLKQDEESDEVRGVGDPLEVAFLAVGAKAGIYRSEFEAKFPEVREEAFDSETKLMATYHEVTSGYRVAVKGAPEPLIASCTSVLDPSGDRRMLEADRNHWVTKNRELAEKGLRVLGLATKSVQDLQDAPYDNLTLVGLVGLRDPPRMEVREAIETCRLAGVRVVMLTGDQPVTALAIADAVGLVDRSTAHVIHGKELSSMSNLSDQERRLILESAVFARVTPKQKLDLIDLHQKNGSIVAMTGDGVNDAPALKKADIGIAMGLKGTEVAREAADMILKDDSFSSIVAAIEQGRIIFDNIRKFVFYLLSCNVAEILIVGVAASLKAPLPLLPLQILFLNVLTDVFPALALAAGEANPGIMRRHPRPRSESFMTKRHWKEVAVYGIVMTVSVLGAMFLAIHVLQLSERQSVTISFLTLGFAQLWHVFNMRDMGSLFKVNEVTGNPFIWMALGFCSLLLLSTVCVPMISEVLRTEHPGIGGWVLIVLASLIPLLVGNVLHAVKSR